MDVQNKRSSDRLKCESLSCSLGTIVNISGAGAGVRRLIGTLPRVGETSRLSIRSRFGDLRLNGRVAWATRSGVGYQAGVEFVELNEMARTILTDIAREHHDRRVLERAG